MAQVVKNHLQCRRPRFDSWVRKIPSVRKIPWRKERLPTPAFLDFPGGSVVMNPPAVRETQVLSPGQENPLKEEMATHSSILAWRILWTEDPWQGPWGRKESYTTERLTHTGLLPRQPRQRCSSRLCKEGLVERPEHLAPRVTSTSLV